MDVTTPVTKTTDVTSTTTLAYEGQLPTATVEWDDSDDGDDWDDDDDDDWNDDPDAGCHSDDDCGGGWYCDKGTCWGKEVQTPVSM